MTNKDAIKKEAGPCIILAGAGTGKTFTIIEKIKYLTENKIYDPSKIVCITFSNEAANNLTVRVNKLLGLKSEPIIRTFHGFSADILRNHADKINLKKDFKILDPDQAKIMLHRNLKVLPINCHRYIATIGNAKDLGIKLSDFQIYLEKELKKYQDVDLSKRLENLNFELQTLHVNKKDFKKKDIINEIKSVRNILDLKKFTITWSSYEKIKVKGNYLDYSDLNLYSLELLNTFPEIANEYSYLIVDEFQDTNKIQLDFLLKMAPHSNITVVGDLNQSIYRFRGAYRENINIFKEHFKIKNDSIFNLTKSFRSPNTVLRTAHKLISNNYENKDDCFFVENAHEIEGDKINLFELSNSREEARKIVEIIKDNQKNGESLEDICIMFRTHQHARIIKRALEQADINYHSITKSSLIDQKSIKTVIDYLTILNKLKRKDRGGEEAWWDLVYQLDFEDSDLITIGKIIRELNKKAQKNNDDNKEILSVQLFNTLDKLDFTSRGKLAAKVIIEKIKLMLPITDRPISELLKEVYRISGLSNEQKTIEEKEIMLNLSKFYELAKTHEEIYDSDLSNFLYYLNLLKDLDIEIDAPELEESGVRLMTSHATKGLEFNVVIISNLAQGRFPIERYHSNSLIPTELLPQVRNELKNKTSEEIEEFVSKYERHNQMQEERRLAYVSFTRAKKKLYLTFADEYSGKKSLPSMFLNEISYKNNPDIVYEKDLEQKYVENEEKKKSPDFITALNNENFSEMIGDISKREEKEIKKFSPSALILFSDCQKEFEYRYIFNMPERKTFSWEAMRLGSFVHIVLERGVKENYKSSEDFLQLAKELILDEEWESIAYLEAETLIKVFFERNKGNYNEKSRTEQFLPLNLSGLDFIGFADRIDFTESGVEIVDYKTGKSAIPPKSRNWQLGFYALAAKEKYGKVRKVILDMLKQDRPLEFTIDEHGNASCTSSKFIDGFNLNDVKNELIDTAKQIQEAYKIGFKPCSIEKNCDFCNEYVYKL